MIPQLRFWSRDVLRRKLTKLHIFAESALPLQEHRKLSLITQEVCIKMSGSRPSPCPEAITITCLEYSVEKRRRMGDETVPPTHKELKEAGAAKTAVYCLCESSVSDLNPQQALTVTSTGEKLNKDRKCFKQSWQHSQWSRTDSNCLGQAAKKSGQDLCC